MKKKINLNEKEIRELAFYIADARRLLNEHSDIDGAANVLDYAAERIPAICWPTEQEYTLGEQLNGARIIMRDAKNSLTLAWFGGHGIHAYTDDCTEVSFWNTGDFSQNDASESAVRDSMERHISGETEYA